MRLEAVSASKSTVLIDGKDEMEISLPFLAFLNYFIIRLYKIKSYNDFVRIRQHFFEL